MDYTVHGGRNMKNTIYKKDLFALTPPMGWNSWDCYAATVNEEQLLSNAQYMAKNLKQYGWQYIVCDIQWSDPLAGSEDCVYRDFAELTMDEYGRLLPAVRRFPSASDGRGFAPIAQKIHDMGLKFGIHIMRGIPRQAVYKDVSIKGSDYTAKQIAVPSSICRWNGDMFGLQKDNEGAQAYYDSIFELYAEWGVDYVKVDDIANTNLYINDPYSGKHEIEMIRNAIDKTGREIVLSLSPGPSIVEEGWHLSKNANLWRITDDFWDEWHLLKDMFRRCEIWQTHVAPGRWPDCDMLPIGKINIGFGDPRYTRFTHDEQRTMMNLWSVFRSPLMMGGELMSNDEWTLSLLTNEKLIMINKCDNPAIQIKRDETQAVWKNTEEDGTVYLGLFNISDEAKTVSCTVEEAGKTDISAVEEVWNNNVFEVSGNEIKAALRPHESVLLIVK